MRTDEELIILIKKNDNDAFSELISSKEKLLYSVALKILRCPEDAEDAVYETFEELCEKVSSIRNGSALTAWLLTTVKRKAFDILRQNKRAVASDGSYEPIGSDPDYTEAIHIGNCLKNLPSDQFTVLSLYGYGLKLREISRIVNKPITTAWATLKRAQANFKRLYEK